MYTRLNFKGDHKLSLTTTRTLQPQIVISRESPGELFWTNVDLVRCYIMLHMRYISSLPVAVTHWQLSVLLQIEVRKQDGRFSWSPVITPYFIFQTFATQYWSKDPVFQQDYANLIA